MMGQREKFREESISVKTQLGLQRTPKLQWPFLSVPGEHIREWTFIVLHN